MEFCSYGKSLCLTKTASVSFSLYVKHIQVSLYGPCFSSNTVHKKVNKKLTRFYFFFICKTDEGKAEGAQSQVDIETSCVKQIVGNQIHLCAVEEVLF